jgi:histidine ammonia-lyase
MCLTLIGEGEVQYKGKKCTAKEALKAEGLSAIELQSKEGLALINGTQFMLAHAVCALIKTDRLFGSALAIAALSIEAFDARPEPFLDLTHQVRNQSGQRVVAQAIRKLLEGSEMQTQKKKHVQDPYSFRCTPQVLGASLDAIEHVKTVVTREVNAVTDNPIIFPEENQIISGGNFHGQPLALSLDFLAIALAEIASLSEEHTS